MERQERNHFNGFDVLLGIGVLAVVVAGMPWLSQQLESAKNVRTQDQARRVAQAILDYHAEMGRWPAADGQPVDLTLLTAVPSAGHALGAMGVADARPQVEEALVDSWGRPFVATVYDESGVETPPRDNIKAFPMTPPPGASIVVVSAGRDGLLQTNLEALAHRSGAFGGDDTGQVLHGREDPLP